MNMSPARMMGRLGWLDWSSALSVEGQNSALVLRCIRMGCKPPAWRQAQILGLLLGMLKTAYGHWLRECVALAQGLRKFGTFAATECLCLWLIGVLHDREEGAACSALRLVFSGSRPLLCICNYNRGSVVTCYDGSLEMCGGGRWGTPATMTFLYSPPVGPSSRKYPLRSSVPSGKSLASAMSTLDFTRRRQCCSLSHHSA